MRSEGGRALLSKEGSVIAKQSREGWFPKRTVSECILKHGDFGTTPRTIPTAVSIVLPS